MPPRTITVSGDAEVASKPDQARLSAGVVSQAETAAAALSANSTAMNRVFTALRAAGIPENRMQTSNFSVQPQYAPYPAGKPGAAADHRVPGVEQCHRRGGRSDQGGADARCAGQKRRQSIGRHPIHDRRSQAARRTRAHARGGRRRGQGADLATAAGVTLGPLMSIQECPSRPMPVFARAGGGAGGADRRGRGSGRNVTMPTRQAAGALPSARRLMRFSRRGRAA